MEQFTTGELTVDDIGVYYNCEPYNDDVGCAGDWDKCGPEIYCKWCSNVKSKRFSPKSVSI